MNSQLSSIDIPVQKHVSKQAAILHTPTKIGSVHVQYLYNNAELALVIMTIFYTSQQNGQLAYSTDNIALKV